MTTRRFILAVAALTGSVWLGGIFLHDSWLRPWPTIVLSCTVSTLLGIGILWLLQVRRPIEAILSIGLVLFALAMCVPLPSSPHFVSVHNETPFPISARFTSRDGARHKEARISAGKTWSFTYYGGSENPKSPVATTLAIIDLSTGSAAERQIELPVRSGGYDIAITSDWFTRRKRVSQ